MSMNGESLADWQTITERLNERIQAWGNFGWMLPASIPVPTTKNHITTAFVSQISTTIRAMFGAGWVNSFWADPDRPLVIVDPSSPYWIGTYQTGNYIYGATRWKEFQDGIDTRAIFATLPEMGAIPLRASVLANLGTFLDMCADALAFLTKTSLVNACGYGEQKWAAFNWDPATGEIFNTNTYALVGSASTFADFYAFALANLSTYTNWTEAKASTSVYNNGSKVWLNLSFSSLPIFYGTNWPIDTTTPGGIHADLTVYYSSFGDNCGYPVNSSTTHLDYSTLTFQNVGPETPITIGFDVSSVSTVPTMPTAGNTYTKEETLQEIHAVWDFSNYFQH